MALEAVLDGGSFDALNFGPDSKSLTVRDVVDLSRKTWPSLTSVEFSEGVLKEHVEATSLQLDSRQARSSLGWTPCWNQSESVIAEVKWWDSVLNNSIEPVVACENDIGFMMSEML